MTTMVHNNAMNSVLIDKSTEKQPPTTTQQQQQQQQRQPHQQVMFCLRATKYNNSKLMQITCFQTGIYFCQKKVHVLLPGDCSSQNCRRKETQTVRAVHKWWPADSSTVPPRTKHCSACCFRTSVIMMRSSVIFSTTQR